MEPLRGFLGRLLLRFWIRRGFKIYPSFYFLLLATAVFFLIRIGRVPTDIVGDIFFLQGYIPHVWEHGWSLAVEEHFYILLPLLLLLLLRISGSPKAIPLISVAASIVCLWLRVLALRRGGTWAQITYPTHLRIDALFAGVTLGYFAHFDPESFNESRTAWFPLIGIALWAIGIFMPVLPLSLSLLYLGFACIVAWAVHRPRSQNPVLRGVAWIGFYSYSIYLWHPLIALTFYRVPQHWWRFPAYVATAVLVGMVMAKLIEIPALIIRDKQFPSAFQHRTSSRLVSASAVNDVPSRPNTRLGSA